MAPNGLPDQVGPNLESLPANSDPPDGVSRSAPPSPTATLTALGAAGRNPTDITLPTVGSQAVNPPGGSHENAQAPESETPVTMTPGVQMLLIGAGFAGQALGSVIGGFMEPPPAQQELTADDVLDFLTPLSNYAANRSFYTLINSNAVLAAPTPQDVEDAFNELLQNKKFTALLAGDLSTGPVEIVVDTTTRDPDLLGLTSADGKTITIFLNNTEFQEWKKLDPVLYKQLLKEVITHEMIHSYLDRNRDRDNKLGLDHNPSPDNSTNNGYGGMSWWMNARYPIPAGIMAFGNLLNHRAAKIYDAFFLDIGPKSQAYLLGIVGGVTPDPNSR